MQQEQRILFKNDVGDYAAVAAGEESVLQAGLRQSVPLNYHCASGSCGSCKARLIQGALKVYTGTDFIQVSHSAGQACECPRCICVKATPCLIAYSRPYTTRMYRLIWQRQNITPRRLTMYGRWVLACIVYWWILTIAFVFTWPVCDAGYKGGGGRAHIPSQILRRIPASWNSFFHATQMERCRRSSVISTISVCNCRDMGHWVKPISVPRKITNLSC